MTPAEREALLSKWIKPSSDDEATQQERAERMVKQAINEAAQLAGVSRLVYAKGSYANNTNVRRDSDVDIVVQCDELYYYEFASGVVKPASTGFGYQGEWTPSAWRKSVVDALVAKFGSDAVNTSGNVAINIAAVPGSRPSIDVVPSFEFRRFVDSGMSRYHEGSCVYPSAGSRIVNWPAQQLSNGRKKNTDTGGRYKRYVRALKNAENALCKAGAIADLPSYLMECLVWNVSDTTLASGALDEGFRLTLLELWRGLQNEATWSQWVEPNQLKWLFRQSQKWSSEDARGLIASTWDLLGYS